MLSQKSDHWHRISFHFASPVQDSKLPERPCVRPISGARTPERVQLKPSGGQGPKMRGGHLSDRTAPTVSDRQDLAGLADLAQQIEAVGKDRLHAAREPSMHSACSVSPNLGFHPIRAQVPLPVGKLTRPAKGQDCGSGAFEYECVYGCLLPRNPSDEAGAKRFLDRISLGAGLVRLVGKVHREGEVGRQFVRMGGCCRESKAWERESGRDIHVFGVVLDHPDTSGGSVPFRAKMQTEVMISFEEALRIVLDAANPLPLGDARLLDACIGLGLLEDLTAALDSPPFTNSAVDGYAVAPGAEGKLRIAGVAAAGAPFDGILSPGEAVRIFTGAPLPPGAESVVMQEDVEADGDSVRLPPKIKPGSHVRLQGEEYQRGQLLLEAGVEIDASVVSLLASNGVANLRCSRRPRVGLVVTGDELAEAGSKLAAGQIFDSNGPALAAAVLEAGADVSTRLRAQDSRERLVAALRSALAESDVLVVSGGVSVGDRDFVRAALFELGLKERFWRISMRPGKPVLFGLVGEKLVFGLPGNPVSSLVTFRLLVRPVLRKLAGITVSEPLLVATLGCAIEKLPGRTEFPRARMAAVGGRMEVWPIEGQGSHMAAGLAGADCLIWLPSGPGRLEEGDAVRVILLK